MNTSAPCPTDKQLLADNQALRARLTEADDTLRAIRTGEVDALVVSGPGGEQVFTLTGADTTYRQLIEGMNEGALTLNDTCVILYCNRSFAAMLKAPLDQVIGSNMSTWVAQSSHALCETLLHSREPEISSNELQLTARDGTLVPVSVSVNHPPPGTLLPSIFLVITNLTEINERKAAEHKLSLAASVFVHAREGILITDPVGAIMDVNASFTRITGYGRDEVLGRNPRLLRSGQSDKELFEAMWLDLINKGHWYGEVWNRRKNGELYAVMLNITALRDAKGHIRQYMGLMSDITSIKAHEKELEHIAHYDALTHLPNRVLLADRLQQAMVQAQRRSQGLAVVYLDLDKFKIVNDTLGHEAGDQLLTTLAARMKQTLREVDTLSRIGGDEFVAILVDPGNLQACEATLKRLLSAAADPVQINGHMVQISASLGITFYPQAEEVGADQLMRQADQAMYQAKQSGKNRYHVFDTEQDRSIRSHHESVERIQRALHTQELLLYYQPQVHMRTGELIAVEALIRWQHPEQGLLLPASFLPVVEDHSTIIELGEWVIHTALTQIGAWRANGLRIPVSVNIGARQMQLLDFVERLRTLLAAHPEVNPADIEMEVLETSALEDLSKTSHVIEECHKLGILFALDDFGTGYSSLTYLRRLPVSQLKIDQSFVQNMHHDSSDLSILQGIIGLANAFQRQVVAEGVETVAQGVQLLQLGCELAQGFCIAHPMPAHDIPAWLASWRPDPAWQAEKPVT